jgi:1-acyl-sn-glycerol-3-phosphate acyltransferase
MAPAADREAALHARSREKGVNPLVYWLIRALFQPFFHLYFRLSRIGREHVPESGPVIFCSNHRSFLDPFVIATIARRPMYYVAKQELFAYHPVLTWLLNALGAFPVRRGAGDQDMLATARTILERGECVLIFSEGTRIRPGALGRPKRGVGRLALETGAPVVPVAVIGTEAVRQGWRIRPHKVRIRVGSPLTFPKVEHPSPQLAAAVTDRIWPNVMLQWEWLGGLPPLRRAAVIGAGSWGTAVATMLARSGLEVDLGCRTAEQAERLRAAGDLPPGIVAIRAGELELSRHDFVCFAVPAGALPAAVAEHAPAIPRRAGVLVLSKGLVGPLGTLPGAYVAERTEAWATGVVAGPASAAAVLDGHASLVVAAADPAFRRQVTEAFTSSGFDALGSADVLGVELAGCARDAAALAAATAAHAGRAAAGSAAGKVFAEVDAYARREGSTPGTFAGLAGAGDLVAAVLGDGTGDAARSVPLLAARIREAGGDAPVLRGLAGVLEGSVEPERWTAALTAPRPAARRDTVRAA